MRRPRLRAFSPWPSVASPTGLETALLTVLSLPARPDRWRPVPAIGTGMIHVNPRWVWQFVLIGVGIAFLLEWRYAQRSASYLT